MTRRCQTFSTDGSHACDCDEGHPGPHAMVSVSTWFSFSPLLSDPQPFERGEVVEIHGGRYQVVTVGLRFIRFQGVPETMAIGRGAAVIEHPPIPGAVCIHCGGTG